MNLILRLSAVALADKVLKRDIPASDIVRLYCDQARKVNPFLNALVKDRFDEALREASALDDRIKGGLDRPLPLAGVPFSVKEMLSLKGMPLTLGLPRRRGRIAEKDGTAVERLRAAGAVPIGVTNIPVIGLHYETRNPVYGQTNNPHNLKHIPGGSSGGEGALIASAGSAFGLGSDMAGSIRMPACFCGIFGHKPSAGLVPSTGHLPRPETSEARRYLSIGPLTRFSEDLMPLLKILAGPDGTDDTCQKRPLGDPETVQINALRIYWVDHENLHPEIKEAQKKALKCLEGKGVPIQRLDTDLFKDAFNIMQASLLHAFPDALQALGDGKVLQPSLEILKKTIGLSAYPWYTLLIALHGTFLRDFMPGRVRLFYEKGIELREKFNRLMGEDGVLLVPTHPVPAVRHGRGLFHIERVAFTGIFNILHAAATAFPAGLSKEGLPLGLQAVSRSGGDSLTIAVAQALEKEGYRWLIPSLASSVT